MSEKKRAGRGGSDDRWLKDTVTVRIPLYQSFKADKDLVKFLSQMPKPAITSYLREILLLGFAVQGKDKKHFLRAEMINETLQNAENIVAEMGNAQADNVANTNVAVQQQQMQQMQQVQQMQSFQEPKPAEQTVEQKPVASTGFSFIDSPPPTTNNGTKLNF